jgi:hypothetical protein
MRHRLEVWRGTEFLGLCSCDLDGANSPYNIIADFQLADGTYEVRYGETIIPMRVRYGEWRRRAKRELRGRRGSVPLP